MEYATRDKDGYQDSLVGLVQTGGQTSIVVGREPNRIHYRVSPQWAVQMALNILDYHRGDITVSERGQE